MLLVVEPLSEEVATVIAEDALLWEDDVLCMIEMIQEAENLDETEIPKTK
jgi:hypothetical protein